MYYLQTWSNHLGVPGAMPPPQDAKTPGCNVAMCFSILSAFGVSAQFSPSKFTV